MFVLPLRTGKIDSEIKWAIIERKNFLLLMKDKKFPRFLTIFENFILFVEQKKYLFLLVAYFTLELNFVQLSVKKKKQRLGNNFILFGKWSLILPHVCIHKYGGVLKSQVVGGFNVDLKMLIQEKILCHLLP